MSNLLSFKHNAFPTIGVELELQLVDLQSFNLAVESKDFLRRLATKNHPGEIKPEITLAMIELNSTVHTHYHALLQELHAIKEIVADESARTHIGVCGGGAHPFQKWQEQRIYPTERFNNISEQYGFLAKQFTVFGQHIHVGCRQPEDALYLCHAFARYLPQFIALSASSPFYQNVDTSFDCARLTIISAFPLSGTPPWLHTWPEFEDYFENLANLGIVKTMKDFYWDIRPKPEYGTIEIRICDTPLTVDKAADLAAYAQMLACWLLDTRPALSRDIYLPYLMNRFNASRYGLDAIFVDSIQRTSIMMTEDVLNTCQQLEPYAEKLNCLEALENIRNGVQNKENDAGWIRAQHTHYQTLADTVRAQVERWQK